MSNAKPIAGTDWTGLLADPDLAKALAMPIDERRERHAALLHHILENNVDKWQEDFLNTLRVEDRTTDESQAATKSSVLDRPRPGRSGVISNAAAQGRA